MRPEEEGNKVKKPTTSSTEEDGDNTGAKKSGNRSKFLELTAWFNEHYFKLLVFTYAIVSLVILAASFGFNIQLTSDRLTILLVIIIFNAALLLSINFSYLFRTRSFSKIVLEVAKDIEKKVLAKNKEILINRIQNELDGKIEREFTIHNIVVKWHKQLMDERPPSGLIRDIERKTQSKVNNIVEKWCKELDKIPSDIVKDTFNETKIDSLINEWKTNPPESFGQIMEKSVVHKEALLELLLDPIHITYPLFDRSIYPENQNEIDVRGYAFDIHGIGIDLIKVKFNGKEYDVKPQPFDEFTRLYAWKTNIEIPSNLEETPAKIEAKVIYHNQQKEQTYTQVNVKK